MKRAKKDQDPKTILLTDDEIEKALQKLKGWKLNEGKLEKDYSFDSFAAAIGFLTTAAVLSESMNHHIESSNLENRVTLKLRSPSVGGITTIDVLLAKKLDQIS